MHGRMELNAVRHAMQIQDAPGDNAGKKLRLTRLYQPVLKGRAYSLHLCLYLTRLSESSYPACVHTRRTVHIRALAVVGGDDGGTRARSLTLCAAHVKSLLAFKCYEHRSRDYTSIFSRGSRFSIHGYKWIKFRPPSFFRKNVIVEQYFSSFVRVASKKWVVDEKDDGTFVLASAKRSIKLSFSRVLIN